MKRIALIGAGGKMGLRLTDNLLKSEYEVRPVEIGEAGRAALARRGVQVVDLEQALIGAEAVILAVPDRLIGKVASQIAPQLAPGTMVVCLDAAAPQAGQLPNPSSDRRDFGGSGLF